MKVKEKHELTASEMCEALGVSMPTLRRRLASGDLKPLPKPDGLLRHHRLRFAPSEVERHKAVIAKKRAKK